MRLSVSPLLFVVLLAGIAGCGVTESKLVGTWTPRVEDDDSFSARLANGTSEIAQTELQLRDDMSCTFRNFGIGVDGTWELEGDVVTIKSESGEVQYSLKVEDNGKQLVGDGSVINLVFTKEKK